MNGNTLKNRSRLLAKLILCCGVFNGSMAVADQKIQDDLIVVGSICVGTDCSTGESFTFDTIRMKENNLRLRFIDTSSTSSFPTGDWQLTANDSSNGGLNKFSLEDIDTQTVPFTIVQGAPNNAFYMTDQGNIGLGTSTPVVELSIKDGNSPTIRLEQDGSSGFTAQSWDVGGNETNFFVRDVSNSNVLPFRIQPAAPNASLFVASDGDVGFGTTTPDGVFDIAHPSDPNNHAFFVTPTANVGVNIDNGFFPRALFDIQTSGQVSRFMVQSDGKVGVAMGVTDVPVSTFEVNGSMGVMDSTGATSVFGVTGNTSGTRVTIGPTDNLSAAFGIDPLIQITGSSSEVATMSLNAGITAVPAIFAFTANGSSKWAIMSANQSGSAQAHEDDRMAWLSSAGSEVFTIHQSGSFFLGTSTGTNRNTTHVIEAGNGAHLTTGGLWTDASSRSLKENVENISGAVAMQAFEKLVPVTFNYLVDPDESHVGFIAEDVPDIVATNDRKGLAAMELVALLTKVVKEQQKSIEELENKVAQLIAVEK